MAEYRTFKAPTQKEAREMMLKSMGSKAYIVVERKVVRRSMFGLKKAEEWEIQAGLMQVHTNPAGAGGNSRFRSVPVGAGRSVENTLEALRRVREMDRDSERQEKLQKLHEALEQKKLKSAVPPTRVRPAPRPSMSPDDLREQSRAILTFADEVADEEMDPPRDLARSFPAKASNGHDEYDKPTPENRGLMSAKAEMHPRVAPEDSAEHFLLEKDFEPAFAQAAARRSGLGRVSGAPDRQILAEAVAGEMVYSDPVMVYETNPNVVFFIGSTGVGKTTTIPKIAFLHGARASRSVVLATFDLWRIMAVEMLRRFASILEMPFEVIHKPEDLITLIKNRMDTHLILVDTGGLPPGEEKKLSEIFELVGEVQIPKEVHLCVSASMRTRDIERTLRAFTPAHFDRLLITKSDETTSLGPVLSVVRRSGVPLSYVTTGQKIPANIFKADRVSLATHLVEEWKR